MISGIWHEGSGLGDQLFRYITVRTLAEKKGYEWGMKGEFKGSEFMSLNRGGDVAAYEIGKYHDIPAYQGMKTFQEKEVRENGIDIRSYDPEINFIEDDTIIDGSFEDSKYWRHNLSNISKWLATDPLEVDERMGLIGFRGGEYATQPDLFLPQSYYVEAMRLLGKEVYQVHSDDPRLAMNYIPGPNLEFVENEPLSHSKHSNMGYNWRSMRYAKYAIIPNSAFFILPRLLKHREDPGAVTIAPRYWARRNTKVWARPSCYYEPLTYV